MNGLYQNFPDIEFEVKIKVSKEIIEEIRSGASDIGLAFLESPAHLKDLTPIEIAKEPTVLVCSPDHPLSNVAAVKFKSCMRN